MQYQVIFWDINYNETPVKYLFNSEGKAQDWVDNNEWEETYYAYDDDRGGDYLETRWMYFNPEDKDNYYGYEIRPIENKVTESFIRMQKLAGIITEQEYNILIKEETEKNIDSMINEMSKGIKDLGLFLRKKGYDV
mgnify:FL=1